jgi:hypothetical protein
MYSPLLQMNKSDGLTQNNIFLFPFCEEKLDIPWRVISNVRGLENLAFQELVV